MFVKSNPQRSLFECEFLLPPAKVERLKKSWAEPFRERVLPLIDEDLFREAFSETTGRPNKPIRLMVCLHLLKEWNDLTDDQVLDELEYNLQWHYALGIESGSAHVCQKTLHNFRLKLLANDRARLVFEGVTRALAQADGLNLGRQRLDSTHVLSNIAVLTRLGLFVETVTHFLAALRQDAPAAFASLPADYAHRYLEREGYFADAKREQARRRLPVVAQDMAALVRAFSGDKSVCELPAFGVLRRLFEEQCEVITDEDSDDDDNGGTGGRSRTAVRLREPKTIASDSLQSPHDPDATYGHKGKGYEVQLAESCDAANPYQLITAVAINGAHESDQKAVIPMLERLEQSGMLPAELLADTGYGSGANIVASALRGVDLQAPVQDPGAPALTEHFAAPVEHAAIAAPEPMGEPPATAVPTSQEPTDPARQGLEVAAPDDATTSPPSTAGSEGPRRDPAIAVPGQLIIGLAAFSFGQAFQQVLACPGGRAPLAQHVAGGQLIATFAAEHCLGCPFSVSATCPTRNLSTGDRQLRRSPAAIATEVRQHEQQQPAFKENYRTRSGVESTNHEAKGRHGLGDLRVRRKPRVNLASQLKSLAINVKRAVQHQVARMAAGMDMGCPCPA